MKKIIQTREIPVIGRYDVVVCGGGPAGWIAAIAAARSGAKTAMVEQFGFAGGMATAGLVLPISVFTYNDKLVCGGIPWEFVRRMETVGGAQAVSYTHLGLCAICTRMKFEFLGIFLSLVLKILFSPAMRHPLCPLLT